MCMDTNIYYKDRKIFMRIIYQTHTMVISQVGGKSFNYIGTLVYERSKIMADYKLLTYYLLSSSYESNCCITKTGNLHILACLVE